MLFQETSKHFAEVFINTFCESTKRIERMMNYKAIQILNQIQKVFIEEEAYVTICDRIAYILKENDIDIGEY